MIWIDEMSRMTDKDYAELRVALVESMNMGLIGSRGYKSWVSFLELDAWKAEWPQLGPSFALENAL